MSDGEGTHPPEHADTGLVQNTLAYRFDDVPTKATDARILIIIHGIANTLLGISYLLWVNSSAENVLDHIFPNWVWPSMFILAGICAFLGIYSRLLAQFAFALAGIVMAIFGVATLYSLISRQNLALTPTVIFLFYLAILKFQVAKLIRQREDAVRQLTDIANQGKSVLDRVKDGSNAG